MYGDYAVTKSNAYGSLTSSRTTYYTEASYSNCTNQNIVVMDCNGNVTDLPPECSGRPIYGKESVTIMRRSIVGPSMNRDGSPVLMQGECITIPVDEIIENYGVYIQETNVVICLKDHVNQVVHPYACVDYARALNKVEERLYDEADQRPVIRLAINDPLNTLQTDTLYAIMFEEIVEIPVDHQMDVYDDCMLHVTFCMGGESFTYSESLAALSNDEVQTDVVELHDGLTLAIAATKRAAIRYKTEHRHITEKDLAEAVDMANKRAQRQIEDQTAMLKSEKERYKLTCQDLEQELERYKAQYNELLGISKSKADVNELQTKERISNNNAVMSENKVKESEIKLYHVAIAAAVPIVIAGVVKLIEVWVKSKSE